MPCSFQFQQSIEKPFYHSPQVFRALNVPAEVMDHRLLALRLPRLVHLPGRLSLPHEKRTSGNSGLQKWGTGSS